MRIDMDGYEMIILADRYDEAGEWLEEELGYDILGANDDMHRSVGNGRMSIYLGNPRDEAPLWGDVTYTALYTIEEFVREFGCEGTYFNAVIDDGERRFSTIRAEGNDIAVETSASADVFGMLSERIHGRQAVAAARERSDMLGRAGGWSEVRIDYLDEADRFWRIDAWRTDDPDAEGKVLGFIDDLTGRVVYHDTYDATDPNVLEAVEAKVNEISARQSRDVHAEQRTADLHGDGPKEQWMNAMRLPVDKLRESAQSLRTTLDTFRNFLLLYEDRIEKADFEDILPLATQVGIADDIDRVAGYFEGETKKLIDAAFSPSRSTLQGAKEAQRARPEAQAHGKGLRQ